MNIKYSNSVQRFLEPKVVPWHTRSKAIFAAFGIYCLIEFLQLLGVATNPSKNAALMLASETFVVWRSGILAAMALLISVSSIAAAWCIHQKLLDWHKAHGQITTVLLLIYALCQPLLAWLLTPNQTRVGLVIGVIYLVFALFAWIASRKAATSLEVATS